MACAPPLQLAMYVVPSADAAPRTGSTPQQLLLVVRFVANPQMPGSLLDTVVDLDMPPQVADLLKVGSVGRRKRSPVF